MDQALIDRLSDVRRRLAALRESEERDRAFGVGEHRFALHPPMDEAQLGQAETELGIELPEDYRCFLTQLGNGGAGPVYGMPVLQPGHVHDCLARPCPFTPDDPQLEKIWERQIDRFLEGSEIDVHDGMVPVAKGGCSDIYMLIVNGPARNRICCANDALDPDAPPRFAEDSTFLDWYERWLDELEAGFDMVGFGCGMIAPEAELVAMLGDVNDTTTCIQVLETLSRRPLLEQRSLEPIWNVYHQSEVSEVRAKALRALHGRGASFEEVRRESERILRGGRSRAEEFAACGVLGADRVAGRPIDEGLLVQVSRRKDPRVAALAKYFLEMQSGEGAVRPIKRRWWPPW